MKKLTNDFASGKQEHYRVDLRVWSEIRYLDSPTDYREYLPGNSHVSAKQCDESLVLLDGCERSFWGWFISLVLLTGAIAIVVVWMVENAV
ncbi:MAG: hypothetical protein ROO76_13130 [Terriglobia bacterium]|nr:hypothetical protein [Terriglobia bacterium]